MINIHQKPFQPFHVPFRMPVAKLYKVKGVGDVIVGKIERGAILPDTRVKFVPSGCTGKVFSIPTVGGRAVEYAVCGDNIGINVEQLPKDNMPRSSDLMVIDDRKLDPDPPKPVETFTVLVFVQRHPGKLCCAKRRKVIRFQLYTDDRKVSINGREDLRRWYMSIVQNHHVT